MWYCIDLQTKLEKCVSCVCPGFQESPDPCGPTGPNQAHHPRAPSNTTTKGPSCPRYNEAIICEESFLRSPVSCGRLFLDFPRHVCVQSVSWADEDAVILGLAGSPPKPPGPIHFFVSCWRGRTSHRALHMPNPAELNDARAPPLPGLCCPVSVGTTRKSCFFFQC